MICSGEQTILLYRTRETDKVHIEKIILSLEHLSGGKLILSEKGIRFETGTHDFPFEFNPATGKDWIYKENLAPANHLFIAGGGHCSLALSKIMSQLDFLITVFDNRPGLKTFIENDAAHIKKTITDYSELDRLIGRGSNHYVVIATFGYRTDDLAIRALINKELRYLGVLGSRSKIDAMFDSYRKEGLAESRLRQIHAPVGFAINSQTPEEIAISIAAEIIAVKNNALPK
jgi:xanthine dehydrogenase accessory factor